LIFQKFFVIIFIENEKQIKNILSLERSQREKEKESNE